MHLFFFNRCHYLLLASFVVAVFVCLVNVFCCIFWPRVSLAIHSESMTDLYVNVMYIGADFLF